MELNDWKNYLSEVKDWLVQIKDYTLSKRFDNEELTAGIKKIELFLNGIKEEEITERDIVSLQTLAQEMNDLLAGDVGFENETRQLFVPIGQHTLPPLPYAYNALEPYISTEIMKLHHDRHHKSYVDGLNKAEDKMKEARDKNDFSLIKHWEREASFNGSGHYLHTLFWEIMSPKGGGEPRGPLLYQIIKDFGSFTGFKNHFSEAAKKVEGGGWALLVWVPRARRLEILQSEKHNNLTQWDTIPLLVLDVWEHAYYLQYKNKREEYVDKWWNVVNWPAVEKRFQQVHKLQWKPS
ncbi:MAG: superoxide dismutase [Bacillus sp. (in: firmicutes)]